VFIDSPASVPRHQSPAESSRRGTTEETLCELEAMISRFSRRTDPPTPVIVQRLKTLAESVCQQGRATEIVSMLDAVIDSPLDLDTSFLDLIQSALDTGAHSHGHREQHQIRVEDAHRHTPVAAHGSELPNTSLGSEAAPAVELADLAVQMQGMNRVMQEHVGCIKSGLRDSTIQAASAEPETEGPVAAISTEKVPNRSVSSTIRGLHVRQGGHHFVVPIDKIEHALDVDVSELPTVRGKAMAYFSGMMCDVIFLAGHLGLMVRDDSSASTLIVIYESGVRVCLAIDEVVGPVEATVTPMDSVLPKVTAVVGVAALDSGGLALVPDFGRLLPRATD